MHLIDKIYIDGSFVSPHGTEQFELVSPINSHPIGNVILADVEDTRAAIAAAKKALPAFSKTSKGDRIAMLHRLHDAVMAKSHELTEWTIEEFGAPSSFASWLTKSAAQSFLDAAKTLDEYDMVQRIGTADIIMEPVGVVGIITPWNANYSFICNKLSMSIAAGCTAVIKPSEMSANQTNILTHCFHEAGLPPGVFNIVTGRGDIVGKEISSNPDISKISFTGSSAVGKSIMREAAETMKRITLELGGKSPTVILDDADLDEAVKHSVVAGFANSGQACINGTRILIPKSKQAEFLVKLKDAVSSLEVGDPRNESTAIGPMVSQKQYDRVQQYLNIGIEEGAKLLVGGPGKPEGLEDGYFVKPTVFIEVNNNMKIAQEEIFGPVVVVIPYDTEEDAIRIANDTIYGLHAYVISSNTERARQVSSQLQAGRVAINGAPHEPLAPFGGYKQSGIGREYGVYGLESYLETKVVLAPIS